MAEIDEPELRNVLSPPRVDPIVETGSVAERLRKLTFVFRAIARLDAARDREGPGR